MEKLVEKSRLAAKIDNTALQDGYQLYHHCFFFTKDGHWAVIQQGMNDKKAYARRYHWWSGKIEKMTLEPHTGIASERQEKEVLNLVAKESEKAQETIVSLASERPPKVMRELSKLKKLVLPRRHSLKESDLLPRGLEKVLLKTYEKAPKNFEELLGVSGLGPKSLRALALLSELVYGAPVSHQDPARYAFAHGGKDGHPYPVNRKVYDQSIAYLEELLAKARIEYSEKMKAFRRLHQLF